LPYFHNFSGDFLSETTIFYLTFSWGGGRIRLEMAMTFTARITTGQRIPYRGEDSVHHKLYSLIVLQILFSTLFFLLYFGIHIVQEYKNSQRNILHVASLLFHDIAAKITIAEEITRFPIANAGANLMPALYRIGKGYPSSDFWYNQEIYATMRTYLNQNPFIEDIGVYDLNGIGINAGRSQESFYDGRINMNSSWVTHCLAKRGAAVFIDQNEFQETDLPAISQNLFYVVRTIMNGYTVKPVGIITVSIRRDGIDRNFDNLKIFSNQEYVFTHNGKSLIHIFDDRIDLKVINTLDAGEQSSTLRVSRVATYVYNYFKFDEDWAIVIRSRFTDLIRGLLRIIIPFFIVIVATVAFIIRVFTQILKSVLTPLEKLVETCDKMEGYTFPAVSESDLPQELKRLFSSFNAMRNRINMLVNEILVKDILKRETELQMLRMQINPHYLYNILECMHTRAYSNHDYDVSTMAELLGRNLQYGLKNINEEVAIETEQDQAKQYANLLFYHYGDNIKINFYIAADIMKCRVIKLILQPVIENSMKHGLIAGKQLCVDILGYVNGNNIEISVSDDGAGIGKKHLADIVSGLENGSGSTVGLQNVHRRLKLSYGQGYGVTINSVLGQGTTTVIKFPFNDREEVCQYNC
jgi:two-component system sensor histidine kinase YesM